MQITTKELYIVLTVKTCDNRVNFLITDKNTEMTKYALKTACNGL